MLPGVVVVVVAVVTAANPSVIPPFLATAF